MQQFDVVITPKVKGHTPTITWRGHEPSYVKDCREHGFFQLTLEPVPEDIASEMCASIRIMPWFDTENYSIDPKVLLPI